MFITTVVRNNGLISVEAQEKIGDNISRYVIKEEYSPYTNKIEIVYIADDFKPVAKDIRDTLNKMLEAAKKKY